MKLNIARRIALSMGVMLILFFGTAIVGYILVSKIEENLQGIGEVKSVRELKIMEMLAANANYSNAILDGLAFRRDNENKRSDAAKIFHRAANKFPTARDSLESVGLSSELKERFSTIERLGKSLIVGAKEAQTLLRRLSLNVNKLRDQAEDIAKKSGRNDGGEMLYQRTSRAIENWFAQLVFDTREPWQIGKSTKKSVENNSISPNEIGRAFIAALPVSSKAKMSLDLVRFRAVYQEIELSGAQLKKLNRARGGYLKNFLSHSTTLSNLLRVDLLASEKRNSTTMTIVPNFFTGESVTFLMLMVAFGGIIGAVAGLVLIRGIISPVKSLSKQISTAENGRFDQRIDVDGDDGLRQIADSFNDLVDQKNATEAALQDLALHDPLTQLPNRDLFLQRLEEATENAERVGRLAAVQILDLDGFKEINDTLGHNVGDMLLAKVAERLKECVRGTDLVARMGGDEFAIIQTNLVSVDNTHFVADRVIASISAPFNLNNNDIKTGTSIGIAVYPGDGGSPGELLQNAEIALKQAKKDGRGHYQLYDAKLDEELRNRRKLEREIQSAHANEEFFLCYQPRMDAAKRQVIGAEALIRWDSPTKGLVRPDEFIPVAESSGEIIHITDFVINETCRQISSWFSTGMDTLTISINLSPVDFRREDLVDTLQQAININGIPADCLELEITEGMVMFGVEEVNQRLDELRHLGVKLAIDDFGTGYSSMSYLKQFNVDTLKIDRSFVNGIPDHREDIGITMAIIRMAHSLNLRVVAEGVENEEQFEFLRRRKCDEVQGYLFARPMLADEFEKFVRGNSGPAATVGQ